MNSSVAFKMGYDRFGDDSYYSWMGGVLPEFRRKGIALKLAQRQEEILKGRGFKKVIFKTRNYLKPMLHFALCNGFQISRVDRRERIEDLRVWLEKDLGK